MQSQLCAIGIFGTLVVCIVSSRRIQTDRVSFQPLDVAFRIWGLIFLSLFVSSIQTWWMEWSTRLLFFSMFLSIALLLSGIWALQRDKVIAANLLPLSAASSLAALLAHPLSEPDNPHMWLLLFGPSLFSGWLSLASVLSIAIALPEEPSAWWLLVPTVVVSCVSLASQNPIPLLSLLWGAYFSPRTWATLGVSVTSLVSLIAILCTILLQIPFNA